MEGGGGTQQGNIIRGDLPRVPNPKPLKTIFDKKGTSFISDPPLKNCTVFSNLLKNSASII